MAKTQSKWRYKGEPSDLIIEHVNAWERVFTWKGNSDWALVRVCNIPLLDSGACEGYLPWPVRIERHPPTDEYIRRRWGSDVRVIHRLDRMGSPPFKHFNCRCALPEMEKTDESADS